MHPYTEYVTETARLIKKGKALPLGGFAPLPRPKLEPNAPVALFFAPHPDDETISGGMALRLMREAGMRVFDVAITQGSKNERKAARLEELKQACDFLGFGLVTTAPGGLDKVHPATRQNDNTYWAGCVSVIREILVKHRPKVILFPHERDWN